MATNAVQDRLRTVDPLLLCWTLFAVSCTAIYSVRFVWPWYLAWKFHRPPSKWALDFSNYWVAAKLAFTGNEFVLFNPEVYVGYLRFLFGPETQLLAWSYPPHFLLFIWPLGYLSYPLALTVFMATTFALFAGSVVAFHRVYAPAASLKLTLVALLGYAVITLHATQNGFLTSALALFTLAYMKERPMLAGLALAALTIKPQLGFLFPILALFDRNWALLRWATLFTLALVVLSALLFGISSWRDFFLQIVPHQQFVMTHWKGSFLQMMPTMYGGARVLGKDPQLALWLHLGVAIPALIATVWLFFRLRDPLHRAFVLLTGTMLISPYAFHYDMGALCVTAAVLAQTAQARRIRSASIIIAMVAVFPGVLEYLALSKLPITPLMLALALVALWQIAQQDASGPEPEAITPSSHQTSASRSSP
jgi:arabinofuranan 3-O-arabinosyltransferase